MTIKSGRLDLLFQEPDSTKRYPQYEHCAVIIAEEITSRFLNVTLIAIQVNANKIDDDDLEAFLEDAGAGHRYRIKLKPGDVGKHKDSLVRIIRKAKGLEEVVEQEVID